MWEKIKALFGWTSQSGTIVWARIQTYVGIVLTVLVATDLSPFFAINPKYMALYLFANGVLTELIRRRKGSQDPVP